MLFNFRPGKKNSRRERRGVRTWPRVRAYLEILEDRCLPTMFPVTTAADSGQGSLRQAILNANADTSPGTDVITFAIGSGVQTIALLSALDQITRPTVLDATTQPGYAGTPLIVLNGTNATASGSDGLRLDASGCTVKGFVINDFATGYGIAVVGNNATIQRNYIGTDINGTVKQGNFVGIGLIASSNDLIGGPFPGYGNIISGNVDGLAISGRANQVEDNTIGLGAAGTALGNTGDGVYVFGPGASGNIIGRTDITIAAMGANTISDNGRYGVELTFGTSATIVEGNYIGTDANNDPNLGNTLGGVHIFNGSTNNQVGASIMPDLGGPLNVISGNGGYGVLIENTGTSGNVVEGNAIGTDSAGFHPLPNQLAGVLIQDAASGNTIGGASFVSRGFFQGYSVLGGAGNLISGNRFGGVLIFEATGNDVEGNFIGTNISGQALTGTSNLAGVELLKGAADNQIGGPSSIDGAGNLMGLGNLISGNSFDGVFVGDLGGPGPAQLHATGNQIEGNFIGTDVTGTLPVPNLIGIYFDRGAVGNMIGGTAAGTRNIISGNSFYGIEFLDSSGNGPDRNNTIENNYVGTDVTGSSAVGNASAGIVVAQGASANTIGGTAQGTGNVISGNHGDGVELFDAGTSGNLLAGNLIGTDASGTMPLGNANLGVWVTGNSNTIGAAGAGNVISGNFNGLELDGSSNVVLGNDIGTDVHGTKALPNSSGILVEGPNNSIGAFVSDRGLVTAGNLVSGNTEGIRLDSGASGTLVAANRIGTDVSGTRKLGNTIYGIQFDGASGNTIGGTAAGAGNLISGNGVDGVELGGSDRNLVLGNLIGTTADGSAALGNGGYGLEILFNSNNNTVGGTTAGTANVIAANAQSGIAIGNSTFDNTDTGNLVQGNFIGTNPAGAALGNAIDGVNIAGSNNTIGGADTNAPGSPLAGAGNVISGNTAFGVEISGSGANNNWVAGNFIGVDASGKVRLANGGGVGLHGGAQDNTVGTNGDGVNDPAEGNVISGNGTAVGGTIGFNPDNVDIYSANTTQNAVAGNLIGTDATGTVALPGIAQSGVFIGYGAQNNRIGVNPTNVGAVFEHNLISGNFANAVFIFKTGTDHNVVAGNFIGTDVTGTRPVPNGTGRFAAIQLSGGSNNTVGGTTTLERNIIIANGTFAVRIRDDSDNTAPVAGNQVLDNYIGVDVTGTHALGTTTTGVGVQSFGTQPVTGTIIGAPGAGNVISGNAQDGIDLNGAGVTGTLIQANYIGTDATGSLALGNGNDGVYILNGASGNTIGGSSHVGFALGLEGAGNVISGNLNAGVVIFQASKNNVQGNFIGTDVFGKAALPNDPSSTRSDGVDLLDGASNNTIGGASSVDVNGDLQGLGNVISGSGYDGVYIAASTGLGGGPATGNVVWGNYIGTDPSGTMAIPNVGNGVHLEGGAQNNLIGGAAAALRNVIAGNGSPKAVAGTHHPIFGAGVQIADFFGAGSVTGNQVEGNYIGTDATGTRALGNLTDGVTVQQNVTGNTIGGNDPLQRNVISGNNNSGVGIYSASGNQVEGNYIGTDQSGTSAIPNAHDGVLLAASAVNNTVGGLADFAANIISGNAASGVHITGSATVRNVVEANFIGTDVTGTHALGNANHGVLIDAGASGNTVGGTAPAARNIISANLGTGVMISQASTNSIQGNIIGTDPSGMDTLLGNRADGILIANGALSNLIVANQISGNSANGVRIGGAGTNFNQVLGNFIGTDRTHAGPLGNGNDGVLIEAGAVASVGDATGHNGNVISANLNNGIEIRGTGTTVTVYDNFIGMGGSAKVALGNFGDGVLIDGGASGCHIGGSSSVDVNGNLSGLGNVISGNLKAGVAIAQASGNFVQGNYIGTDITGTTSTGTDSRPLGNAVAGVLVELAAFGNTIGGDSSLSTGSLSGFGNLISGNLKAGVDINQASANAVQGNLIGTDVTGAATTGAAGNLGNLSDGVLVEDGATSNTIGGPSGTGNFLSHNLASGVHIDGTGTSGNQVIGNLIGLSANGTAPLGNHAGVLIADGASQNTIGGPTAVSRNVISSNRENGVDIDAAAANVIQDNYIGLNAAGTAAAGNANEGISVYLGAANNTIASNVISGNGGDGIGIFDSGTTGNVVQANFIGTDPGGQHALTGPGQGNGRDGVRIQGGASGNTIGGYSLIANSVLAGAGNVISGNPESGVLIYYASGNAVEGNFIGTNRSGTGAVPNGPSTDLGDGVDLLAGATGNVIGGAGEVGNSFFLGNLISGNSFDGVFLAAEFGAAAVTSNLVEGNLIGTDVTGTKQLANAGNGVHLEGGAQGNTIGGTDPTVRNIISGNGGSSGTPAGAGVQIADLFGTGGVSGNVVEGNYVGTDISGTHALGNVADGVILQHGVTGNTVGGTALGAGNLISGNTANGVRITGTGTTGNVVQGNLIGTQADGTHALPNDVAGVGIFTGASGNVIGGPAFVDDAGRLAGAGNVISGNGATNTFQPGVSIANASANLIQGNFIGTDRTGKIGVANAGDGIDIDDGINNQIGGASSLDAYGHLTGLGNVVSGNTGTGIAIFSFFTTSIASLFATGNRVEGNFIGTDVTGSKVLSDQLDGVDLGFGAAQNTVGGTAPGTRNIISGNGTAIVPTDGAGVVLGPKDFPDENNLVENNYIGTDVTGLHPLGNVNEGVLIQGGAQNNQVGAAGAGNLISGNPEGVIISGATTTGNLVEANTIGLAADGSRLGNTDDGVRILDGATNNRIGTAGAGNIISGNAIGVYLAPSSGTAPAPVNNLIQGNYIGTDPTGEVARPNSTAGIVIAGGAAHNQIGGAGQANVIAANGSGAALTTAGYTGGVIITDSNTSGNVLEDNLIGTEASGTQALGNTYAGVVIRNGASGNRIQRAQTGNVISANVAAPGPQGGFGVFITGSDTTNNVVTGNFIGTDRTGTQALGGQVDGVEIANGANNDHVGAAGKPNIISGNTNAGVEFTGQNGQNTFADDVLGNLIGTDVTGTLPLGNGTNGTGVLVHHGAANIVIGEFGAGNVISGNEGGVAVYDNPASAIIDANYIGTDITGTKGVGNLVGIFISTGGIADIGTPFAGIGTAGEGNVIAANTRYGIWFPGGSGSVFDNLISGNGGDGIHIGAFEPSDTQAVSIQGNLIGTGASGTVPFPNKGYGIFIDHAHNVTVGGTDPGTANVVSGNTLGGIHVEGNDLPDGIISAWQMQRTGARSNPLDLIDTLARNTALAYNTAFVPYRYGQAVSLDGVSSYVRVPQHATLHPANLTVSAFVQFNALDTAGAALPGLEYILFQQNSRSSAFEGYSLQKLRVNGVDRFEFIVSSAGGRQVVAISKTAVVAGQVYHVAGSYNGTTVKLYVNGVLEGSQTAGFPLDYGNTDLYWGTSGQPSFDGKLGGLIGEVNIYGRALSDGEIASLAANDGVSNNVIAGNSIGTDLHDTIPLGNGGDGIDIVNSSGNTIGATVTASDTVPATGGNFIDFNRGNGVLISGALAQANQVNGNFIGTDMDGTADQGNLLAGVRLDTGANGTYLSMNRSSFNGRQGFVLEPDAGTGNALFDNSVTGNALGGIDLKDDGPSLNTPTSPHMGPNHMQNYPVITSAAAAGGMTVIQVSLNSTAGRQFDLEFFANDSLDASGYAQGETVLTAGGNLTLYPVTTDPSGNATATVTFPSYLKGKYITATATDLTSADTSEFSAPVLVGTLAPVITGVTTQTQTEGLAQSISVSGTYFDRGATVLLNGTPLATTFGSDMQLSALIPAGVTEEGVNEVVTVVNPAPDAATSAAQSFSVNDAPLTIAAATVGPTEGVPFSAGVVASFTDTGGLESLDDYSAFISWGDGSASNGVISFPSGGGALVLGDHTYLEEGPDTITIEVSDDGGRYALTSETIQVGDAPLKPEAKANVPFIEAQSATVVVGSFTDADPHGFAGMYNATINWGDPIVLPNGTMQQDITPGTVVADGAGFDVVGTHTYSQAHDVPNLPFSYPVTVTVTDATAGEVGGPNSITINSSAAVSPLPLVATGIPPFAVVNGAVNLRVVADFTDPDGRTGPSNASKYSAVIDWGDGTPASQGQIATDGAAFKVTAPAHNYGPFPGTRSFTVTITDLVVNGPITGQGRIVTVVDRVVDPPLQNKNGPFVYQVYEDLLGRAPTDTELSHWTGLMDHGTTARQMAAGLMRGQEYRTIEAQTAYHTYLQRDASAAELAVATHFLAGGGTVEQLQVRLVTSPEYWRLEGGTAAGFLDGLYQEALGHAPSAGVLAAAIRALHPGQVAAAVFASAEYRRDLIVNDYARLLAEAPDRKTEQAYLGMLANGSRDEGILAAIFGSAEYRKWFS
jgi:hypothetical protein